MTIGLINYGIGNLTSVKNALNAVGVDVEIVESSNELSNYEKLILPGVGAFGRAMENLKNEGWIEALNDQVIQNKKPILGLCLGMQLMFEQSDENGPVKGLGWISGTVKSIADNATDVPVTHMGWNNLVVQNESKLLSQLPTEENDMYFVHGYYCSCTNKSDVVATTNYGIDMDVIIQHENIYGCQFHPEKSHSNGLTLLRNFANL